jgi:hypothetical protein
LDRRFLRGGERRMDHADWVHLKNHLNGKSHHHHLDTGFVLQMDGEVFVFARFEEVER